VVNLTEAESFPEFVHQVRREKRSHVLFMPQYNEPLVLRIALSVLDVMREYPDYAPGSRRWDERVFHPNRQGEMRPLAEMWEKPPALIRFFANAVNLLEAAYVRRLMRFALTLPPHEPRLLLGENQEVAL
jgi:hypothetical protein